MYFPSRLLIGVTCLLTLCQAQTHRYSGQGTFGGTYSAPSSISSYYKSVPGPSYSNSYNKQLGQRKGYLYSSSTGLYNSYKQPAIIKATLPPYSKSLRNSANHYYDSTLSNGFYRNAISSISSSTPSYISSTNKQYSSDAFNKELFKRDSSAIRPSSAYNMRVSKADAENDKFAGAENQENDDDARTLYLKRKKLHRFGGTSINPCFPYGKDAAKNIKPPHKGEGRFLWDVNVYNVYPQASVGLGCGYYGGFGTGLGGPLRPGLFSDPISPAYYPPGAGIANFLSLFAPGILQNSLAVTARPQQYADHNQLSTNSDLQSDPEVDPNYRPDMASVPIRRPNRVFYDSVGVPPITPGQLVGGISTTVNGIIQQLTGNVQPVYG